MLAIRATVEGRLEQGVSPQLIQQSQLLEYNCEDLAERVQEELDANPALELNDNVFQLPGRSGGGVFEGEGNPLDRLPAPSDAGDELRLQWSQVRGFRREVGEYLIESLDERGFLGTDAGEVARRFGMRVEQAEAAITALQSLEPAGIGARDLCECLLLQVSRFDAEEVPPQTAQFILRLMGSGKVGDPAVIARQLRLTDGALALIVRFIADRLYLRPSDLLPDMSRPVRQVLPDARVTESHGRLQVKVAQSWSRGLRVSEAYARLDRALGSDPRTSREDCQRIREKVRGAREFIHHLVRREAVLKRVTEFVVNLQHRFLTEGPEAMLPLTRKQVATALSVHQSTVSRVTRAKYVTLPDERTVPLELFFGASLPAKTALKALVAGEDRACPQADCELARRLEQQGYDVARRTVAKYRDQLGIPSAHRRRKRALAACG